MGAMLLTLLKRFGIEVDVWSIILEKVSPPDDCDGYNKFV